jgi:hypothetical protein
MEKLNNEQRDFFKKISQKELAHKYFDLTVIENLHMMIF